MLKENIWKRLALGAAAGFAGTAVMQILRMAEQKWVADAAPPIRDDPGSFMVSKAKQALPETARQRLPAQAEKAAIKLLPVGYGMTFGVLYATARPEARRAVLEGALLGLAAWAVGYLGWLPATGLMPPIWKHKPRQVAVPVAEHALYGLATVAGYRWFRKLAHV